MAIFLDDISPLKLYKTKFYLPVNMRDRKLGSVIFLLSKNIDKSIQLMQNPLFINIFSFLSYYIERDVMLYLNEQDYRWLPEDSYILESLTAKERDAIPKEDFGLPDERKYPLDSEEHVRSAIKLFGHCEEDKKIKLAKAIMEAARKYNIEIDKNTEVYKYAHLASVQEEILLEEAVYDVVHEYRKLAENTVKTDKDFIQANIDGNEFMMFFEEAVDTILENGPTPAINHKLRSILFQDRLKTQKEQLVIFDYIKNHFNTIKYMYIKLELYRKRNLFVDLSYYLDDFFRHNMYKLDFGLQLFGTMIQRAIKDKRIDEAGYTKKTVFINVKDWRPVNGEDIFDYKNINPISLIHRYVKLKRVSELDKLFGGIDWVFMSDKGYFKCKMSDLDQMNLSKFRGFINKLLVDDLADIDIINKDSRDVILTKFADRLAKNGVEIHNLTGETNTASKEDIKALVNRLANDEKDPEIKKAMLVHAVSKVAEKSESEDDMYNNIEDEPLDKEWLANIIDDLESEEGNIKVNKARSTRMAKLNSDLMRKQLKGKTIKDYLDHKGNKEIPKDIIPIDSIDEDWHNVTFSNFSPKYNLDEDLVSIFTSLIDKSTPISIIDIDKEDNSTTEDYIETWTVKFEDVDGNRFSVKLDIPKFIDGRFMKLRGNLKTINAQLMLIPVIKTDEDTAQIVSNYNKIFIRRFNPSNGTKTTRHQSILSKILSKYEGKTFKAIIGNNSVVCKKYELPIEYRDLAALYNRIEFYDGTYISFNMDTMTELAKSGNCGLLNYDAETSPIYLYYDKNRIKCVGSNVSESIIEIIEKKANETKDKKLLDLLSNTKPSDKLSYSVASILNTEIPVIVVMAYSEGLQTALNKAGITFRIQETRPNVGPYIKFKDGYLSYVDSVESSLLLSGLCKVDTELYSIKDINRKEMWIDSLEEFGGRIKADGLDNFYDMMIDPITKEVCELYHLPTDYVSILGYASSLLADTKYNKHTDISGNRFRTNEIIAAYTYKVLANAYGEYKTQKKRNKSKAILSVKQSAVIDAVLQDPTASDLSILTPLLEAEAAASVSFKGLSGLNSERAYSLDKRVFDKSMLGVIGLSTGFAGNVGITRQTTINANVTSTRGIIKTPTMDKVNTLNSQTVTEALTPFMTTHDDPMRIAMGFIQTSKHQMRVKRSSPNLVTTGMDEAIPYITSNIFSYKFKGKRGKVIDVTDRWIVYQDLDTKEKEFVDLEEKTMKNSDGGFYVTLKLTANVKKGQSLKYNDILAYDKTSYSKQISGNKNDNGVSYNVGTLAKIAIMPTDEAYNDSAIITESLSDSLTSVFCVEKTRYLPKDTNVYNLVKKGQSIQEGEPLLIFQNAFEEKDANALLKSITDDELEAVSDLGRIHVRSKITGKIQDVKIYRTCDIDELSPSLKKIVTEYESRIKKEKAQLKKLGIDDTTGLLDADYKLEPQGKLKDCIDGVKIFIYISCADKMGVGDKLVYSSALKGTVKYIINKGDEPTTDFRPNEYIEALLTTSGVNARMVGSVIINGSINKVLVELDRYCKEKLGIPWKNCYEIETNE